MDIKPSYAAFFHFIDDKYCVSFFCSGMVLYYLLLRLPQIITQFLVPFPQALDGYDAPTHIVPAKKNPGPETEVASTSLNTPACSYLISYAYTYLYSYNLTG